MKFKVEQSHPLFAELRDLFTEGQRCEDKAEGWLVRNTGRSRKFGSPDHALFGGIAIVQLPSNRNGWKCVDRKRRLFKPTGATEQAVNKLPTVPKDRLRGLLNYGRYPGPRGINTIPSVNIGEDYAIIAVPDHVRGYEPVDGMRELFGSEYNRLYDAAEEYRKRPEHPEEPTFTNH